ncbi:hypothetical protein Taro_031114 [Colocasia esculenta]|uniref:Uncharacterized protein n=1 Tax=Colocasia esculenta TaxID=4460 RepID=A0A843VZX0_COLES|nr:hypothetical protein [Colocasia esculenta]
MTQLLRLSALHNTTTHIGDHRLLSREAPPPFPAAVSFPSVPRLPSSLYLSPICTRASAAADGTIPVPDVGSGGGNSSGGSAGGRGSGGGGGASGDSHRSDPPRDLGLLGLFLEGWRSRVAADPQFPFKVLMEELVGVTACVLGDMASRPNFGLNELDFVFSTLVVGSILNFVLMYLLAPTAASSASAALPGLFARCPPSHMFEPGTFSLLDRMGTFVYKGALFATVGFAAGLAGTAISNGLMALRKKMDPAFETPNKPPPTVLNALTWAIHMGVSSNLRYQSLNGVEFLIARVLPPAGFKASVVVLRCLNNVLGGFSFVMLARLTGSQKVEEGKAAVEEEVNEKLLPGEAATASGSENGDEQLQRTETNSLTSRSSANMDIRLTPGTSALCY